MMLRRRLLRAVRFAAGLVVVIVSLVRYCEWPGYWAIVLIAGTLLTMPDRLFTDSTRAPLRGVAVAVLAVGVALFFVFSSRIEVVNRGSRALGNVSLQGGCSEYTLGELSPGEHETVRYIDCDRRGMTLWWTGTSRHYYMVVYPGYSMGLPSPAEDVVAIVGDSVVDHRSRLFPSDKYRDAREPVWPLESDSGSANVAPVQP